MRDPPSNSSSSRLVGNTIMSATTTPTPAATGTTGQILRGLFVCLSLACLVQVFSNHSQVFAGLDCDIRRSIDMDAPSGNIQGTAANNRAAEAEAKAAAAEAKAAAAEAKAADAEAKAAEAEAKAAEAEAKATSTQLNVEIPGHVLGFGEYNNEFLRGSITTSTQQLQQQPPPKDREPIPRYVVDPLFKKEHDRIDTGMDDAKRCAQFGVEPLPEPLRNKRRLFFGAMLADENPEVMEAHAIEVYNQYSVVALVESNTTHVNTPRKMHYGPGSHAARRLVESGMFGDQTNVVVGYWLEDKPGLRHMEREVEQRNTIWKIWLRQGMTQHDVGVMSDFDEIISRDYLNALKVCDFEKLRFDPAKRANCKTPKINLSTVQFEASPLCIKKREWFHPDIIGGACISGVGDPIGRVVPERNQRDKSGLGTMGIRKHDYGKDDHNKYPQDVIDNDRYPLWDGRDIRTVNGNDKPLMNYQDRKGHGQTAAIGTAYHLHNWFPDLETQRHKYKTYGHGSANVAKLPLSKIQGDVDVMVRCAHGYGNTIPESLGIKPDDGYDYFEDNQLLESPAEDGSLFSVGGNRPIYFSNRTYVEARHALVQALVKKDEEKYGTIYNGKKD